MIHCERKKTCQTLTGERYSDARRSQPCDPRGAVLGWAAWAAWGVGGAGGLLSGASAGHRRKVPETARRLRMETASAQTGEMAGVLTSKIYQQLATLSKLGWIGKDVTFSFIYKCGVWNSYGKVFPLSTLKDNSFPLPWTFWNGKSKSGMQRVHFNENAGCCRAHNAAYIRFSTLKINEEPRKNFT